MVKPVSESTNQAEIAPTLEQTLPQMAKDAARYRWLRDNRSSVTYTIRPGEESSNCEIHGHDGWTRRCDMDAAIDAAMKG